jgi:membrane associated rhomboid family serine protease
VIAIPLSRNFSWRNPPLVTVGLILINLFIFAVLQHEDDDRWDDANQFYVESGLGRLEEEFYQIYRQAPGTSAAGRADLLEPLSDARFQEQLYGGLLLPETEPQMRRWRHLRSEYDARMNTVVTFAYGFKPAYPRPATWISCMFLHAGWGHLIGNMIFLWLIGCLIEYGCRYLVFPFLYLAGGIAGTALFWLLNPLSTIPLVGASGAIAGIMGAFTVFYGFKKVRIFLNLGFYFNYLQFSAIWLLPLWMSNELLQMFFNSSEPVAYAAHLGGLGLGALLAWGARRIPGFVNEDAFQAAEQDHAAPLLEQALSCMGALNFPEARRLLEEVLEHDPEHLAALQHLYTIDRQNPGQVQHHLTAGRLLSLLCRKELFEKVVTIFREYTQTAKPPKLSADLYLQIAQCLIASKNLADAQQLVFALIKKAPRHADLPVALFRLSLALRKSGSLSDSARCLILLQKHFPMSDEARIAAAQMKETLKA